MMNYYTEYNRMRAGAIQIELNTAFDLATDAIMTKIPACVRESVMDAETTSEAVAILAKWLEANLLEVEYRALNKPVFIGRGNKFIVLVNQIVLELRDNITAGRYQIYRWN